MIGDPIELKWNRKDLGGLNALLPFIKQRRAVVQAGGCLGVFPKRLAQEFATVYTFEPSTQFVAMTANAPEDNIIRSQFALGESAGMVHTRCALRNGKTSLHPGMTWLERGGTIPTIALDWLELPYCDLIYLDVEGYELHALRGACETIRRCKPMIVCEINRGLEHMGFTGDQLRAFLSDDLGYKYHSKHRSDEAWNAAIPAAA